MAMYQEMVWYLNLGSLCFFFRYKVALGNQKLSRSDTQSRDPGVPTGAPLLGVGGGLSDRAARAKGSGLGFCNYVCGSVAQ